MPKSVNAALNWVGLCSIFLLITNAIMFAQKGIQEDTFLSYIPNHLPVDNQNWEICQDPLSGFLYFANSAGLVEYNGISQKIYTMPFKQGVRSVYVSRDHVIYSGSFEDFGFWEHDGQGGLEYHSLTTGIRVAKNDEIWNILELDGTIYFQSFTTIYAYHNNSIKVIPGPAVMLFMFRFADGFVIQALGKGLYHFNGQTFLFIDGSQLFGMLKVHALIERPGGKYWICTANNGIYLYDGTSFAPLKSEVSEFLKHQTCNAGLALYDSLLVFGTILNGIVFCDEQGTILKTYNYANGLNNNTVLSLYRDMKEGLWVGLDEGANYINLTSPFKIFADAKGTLGTIYTVIRKDNLLYLGTNHGLFVAEINYNLGEYTFSKLSLIPNSQGQVWKLYEFGNQILCGHNDGTFLVNGRSIRKISEVTGGWTFAGYNDLLLEGTYTGIVSFSKDHSGNWVFRNRVEGFYEPTQYIEVDYKGFVWAIHPQKGIYRLELSETLDSVVNTLHFNSIANIADKISISMINNQVMFMTSENIYSFDYERKSFFPVQSLATGLGEYMKATEIIHHEKNTYWFVLANKIALFEVSKSLEALKIKELFQKYTALPGREQQIITLDRTTMLIPTRRAFTTYNLLLDDEADLTNAPVITRLVFSGKKGQMVFLKDSVKKATVPSFQNNLTVYLADPIGFDQANKEFLYRIPDLDETWHQTVEDHFTFLNLRFGTYRLQVRSTNGEEIAETAFVILRPWYLSLVAILIYILSLAGITALSIRIFRIELNRHRRLIEYEVKKNKLESELDYKSYELMLTMRYLIRKTEILKVLQQHIHAMKTDASKYPVKYVREMEKIINEGLDSQTEEWKNTMNTLKLSQEGFFRKLKEKFPDLTPNDLRLCSYLRMNLTTKEMAHLLNISGRSVEIGRYRLRRKMNLSHNVNLTEYLIKEAENTL